MRTDVLAKVLTVGGGSVVLEFVGQVLTIPALPEEERAFGAVLYRQVRVTINVEPKAVAT